MPENSLLEKLSPRKFNFVKGIVETAVRVVKVHVRVYMYRMNKFRNNITPSRSA